MASRSFLSSFGFGRTNSIWVGSGCFTILVQFKRIGKDEDHIYGWEWPLIISDLFDRMMEFPVIFDRWCVGNIIVPDGQSGRSIRSVCSHSEEDGREGRSSLLHSAFVVQHFVSSAVLEMNASPSSGKKQIRLGQMEQFCPDIWPRSTRQPRHEIKWVLGRVLIY